jgi:hypothetical protein
MAGVSASAKGNALKTVFARNSTDTGKVCATMMEG